MNYYYYHYNYYYFSPQQRQREDSNHAKRATHAGDHSRWVCSVHPCPFTYHGARPPCQTHRTRWSPQRQLQQRDRNAAQLVSLLHYCDGTKPPWCHHLLASYALLHAHKIQTPYIDAYRRRSEESPVSTPDQNLPLQVRSPFPSLYTEKIKCTHLVIHSWKHITKLCPSRLQGFAHISLQSPFSLKGIFVMILLVQFWRNFFLPFFG